MPSATTSPAGPFTIPPGGEVGFTIDWQLDPGSPDQDGHLTLKIGDTVVFDDAIVRKGSPAETAPAIRLPGETVNDGDALLFCDVGTLERVSDTSFRLT